MTASGFHLDIASRQTRHSEATKYVVAVLWTAGFSATTIANMVGLRRSQALGRSSR